MSFLPSANKLASDIVNNPRIIPILLLFSPVCGKVSPLVLALLSIAVLGELLTIDLGTLFDLILFINNSDLGPLLLLDVSALAGLFELVKCFLATVLTFSFLSLFSPLRDLCSIKCLASLLGTSGFCFCGSSGF